MKSPDTKSKPNNRPKRMRWYEAEVTCKMGITGYEEKDAREALEEHLKEYTKDAKIHKFYLKAEDAWAYKDV